MSIFKRKGVEAWLEIFNKHSITYATKHKNCKRGNVVIDCPFCANSEGKFHMGVDKNGRFGCWKNQEHRGSSPHKLLVALLRISPAEASRMVGADEGQVDEDDWNSLLRSLSTWEEEDYPEDDDEEEDEIVKGMKMPKQFIPVAPFGDAADYFYYIMDRGFPRKDVRKLVKHFDLRCCDTWDRVAGKIWYERIITPVCLHGELMCWGSRTINPDDELRYMSLPADESIIPVKELVYNYDNCMEGGKILLLVEGQVDVWKLDFYGKEHGIRAAGLFSKSIVPSQVDLVHDLKKQFDHTFLLLDANEEAYGLSLCDLLNGYGKRVKTLIWDGNDEDPGAATYRELETFFKKLLKKTLLKRTRSVLLPRSQRKGTRNE
ncbi:hypothetical protein F862_gp064 [Vibrio phage vB_VpaS_MAR10]|uniref:DNA primase n=1 Tax=Vibrio phage vB_VpaS_MAR10 TaxID=1229755 RepID=K7R6G3_9CAUD|nr:hypothetical protein F862_gp064 [Vibrio phage vB_VpaS_MAR10]AFV81296.1 hypothetical protein MAR10_063 [Vibrio phage vB_VpaS_MAR10]